MASRWPPYRWQSPSGYASPAEAIAGRPVSQVTEDFLAWVCARLAVEGKKALLLVWDNASWHNSQRVRAWIKAHNRQAKQQGRGRKAAPPSAPAPTPLADIPLHRRLKEQRQQLHDLVGLWAHRTNAPHGSIHSELRRLCGGPAVAQATEEQLQARIALLRKRING